MKYFALLFLLVWDQFTVIGQENEKRINIKFIPLKSDLNNVVPFLPSIQGTINAAFSSKKRFNTTDLNSSRSTYNETELQKGTEFINGATSINSVDQTIEYLLETQIQGIQAKSERVERTRYLVDKTTGKQYSEKYYVPKVSVSIATTFQLIYLNNNKYTNKAYLPVVIVEIYDGDNTQASIEKTIPRIGSYLKAWLNKVFPVEMKVVKIESSDKKGNPVKILVSGGEEMNFQSSKSGLFNTSTELSIVYFEDPNKREMENAIVIGTAIVEDVQGDISLCRVKKGAEAMRDKLNQQKTLYALIKSY